MNTYCSVLYRSVLLAVLMILSSSCENNIEKIKLITSEEVLPTESGRDVEIQYSDSGMLKAKMIAPVLNRYTGKEPYMDMPEGVTMYFYNDAGEINSTITSKYARIIEEQDNSIMEARNDVVVINEKKERLNTEQLTWNQKEEKITSDAFVRITRKEDILMGDGLDANQDFTRYRIKKLRGTITVDEEEEESSE
jgi:LPS export ABC transporter protein LptC